MISLLDNLWDRRELCASLVRREVTARYKQSLLGPAWAVLQPLSLLLVFGVVQSFVPFPSEGVPYAVFLYAGLVPWTFFSSTLALMTPSIISNGAIVKKVYFPREILPISAAFVGLLDLVIAFLTLLALMTYHGVPIGLSMLQLPMVVLVLLVFVVGLGLLTSAVCAFQRDILFVAVFVLQLWMYVSPVLYPLSAVPERYRSVYLLNPLAALITLFRNAVLGVAPDPGLLGVASLEAVVTLAVGYAAFKSLEKYFADAV